MYADIETLYRTTIDRNPECWLFQNNLGLALAGRGQVDEAVAHFQKALEIKPDCELAHNNLGVVLAGRGRVEEAIAHFQKALEIKPDDADTHNNYGLVLAGRGQVDEAIAHFQKVLEINPDNAGAHNNLGVALAGAGGSMSPSAITKRPWNWPGNKGTPPWRNRSRPRFGAMKPASRFRSCRAPAETAVHQIPQP